MADFRIWAKVEHVGVKQFLAIASAVPEVVADRPVVLTSIAPTLVEANEHKAQLMVELGDKVRARGDRVVDVEE